MTRSRRSNAPAMAEWHDRESTTPVWRDTSAAFADRRVAIYPGLARRHDAAGVFLSTSRIYWGAPLRELTLVPSETRFGFPRRIPGQPATLLKASHSSRTYRSAARLSSSELNTCENP
jgi:hypothetical protein